MLDIGWWELLVVGMVALVVVGPKELPTLLRTIGRYVGMAKRQADEFRSQFDDAMRESEFNDLRNEMNDIKSGVTSSLDDAQTSINKELNETDYDWDDEEPIKPAPEFADDEPTTSFTTPDGEVITKQDDGVGSRNDRIDDDAITANDGDISTVTQTAANDTESAPAPGDAAPTESTETKAASTRDAEAVR